MNESKKMSPEEAARALNNLELIDERLRSFSPAERDRIRRENFANVKGPHADRSHLSYEDQILVCVDWSHHKHCPRHLEAACQIAAWSKLDWDDLVEWTDRYNSDWALPWLREAAKSK